MEPKTATLVKIMPQGRVSYFGDGLRLYRCSPPMSNFDGDKSYEFDGDKSYEYVVASSVEVPFSGPETYLFGADEHGTVVDWCGLPGSRRGRMPHSFHFSDAGYNVVLA